jgi:hypothetical protein
MDSGHGDGEHELRSKVAVACRVEAVGDNFREAETPCESGGIDVIARTGDRARAQRHRVSRRGCLREALDVALERRDVRKKEMCGEHRLRAPQMCVGGHHCVAERLGLCDERKPQRPKLALHCGDAASQIQAQIERHLFVPRAAGVKSPSGVARAGD